MSNPSIKWFHVIKTGPSIELNKRESSRGYEVDSENNSLQDKKDRDGRH